MLRPDIAGGFTLQSKIQNQETGATPTLRSWLGSRSASERATLARLWSLPESASSSSATLAAAMLDRAAVAQVVAALGPRERAALILVQQHGGRVAAPQIEREYGGLRAHADYPNPRAYLLALEQPPSPTERLWAMALLLTSDGATRSYTIPTDLLALLPAAPARAHTLELAPAAAPEQVAVADPRLIERSMLMLLTLAQDGLLEVVPNGGLNKASLVRIARQSNAQDAFTGTWREDHWPYIQFVRLLAEGAGLLRIGADSRLRPTHAALEWLQAPPIARARGLLAGWVTSKWDELASFQRIKIQRDYFRDLPGAKRAVLRLISQLPANQWISIAELVAQIKQIEPDFARPDGRYDTWGLIGYAREPLNGFEHWDAVEGAQLKAIVSRTFHWLGLTDLGIAGDRPASLRLSSLGAALLVGAPAPAEPPSEPLLIQPNFAVLAPAYASPYARFQLGRIAERAGGDATEIYTLTKRSLQSALNRGISLHDVLRFLQEQSAHEPPQNVVATLREWASQHGQLALRRGVLLEAAETVLLEQIKRDKRVRVPEFEQLTPQSWLIREGDAPELAERLRKAGYGLTGDGDSPHTPLREHDLTVVFAALEFYAQACDQLGIENDAGGALRRRVARLLPDRALNRAFQTSHAALRALKERLEKRQ